MVERFFRTIAEDLFHTLPGAARPLSQRRDEEKSWKGARITLSGLRLLVHKWISADAAAWMGDLVPLLNGTVPLSMPNIGLDASDTLHLAMSLGLMFDRRWRGSCKIRNLPQHDPALIDAVMATGMDVVKRWPSRLTELVEERRSKLGGGRGFMAWLKSSVTIWRAGSAICPNSHSLG